SRRWRDGRLRAAYGSSDLGSSMPSFTVCPSGFLPAKAATSIVRLKLDNLHLASTVVLDRLGHDAVERCFPGCHRITSKKMCAAHFLIFPTVSGLSTCPHSAQAHSAVASVIATRFASFAQARLQHGSGSISVCSIARGASACALSLAARWAAVISAMFTLPSSCARPQRAPRASRRTIPARVARLSALECLAAAVWPLSLELASLLVTAVAHLGSGAPCRSAVEAEPWCAKDRTPVRSLEFP